MDEQQLISDAMRVLAKRRRKTPTACARFGCEQIVPMQAGQRFCSLACRVLDWQARHPDAVKAARQKSYRQRHAARSEPSQ